MSRMFGCEPLLQLLKDILEMDTEANINVIEIQRWQTLTRHLEHESSYLNSKNDNNQWNKGNHILVSFMLMNMYNLLIYSYR